MFASEAVAYEQAAPTVLAEFRRKQRTAFGLAQAVPHLGWLFVPRRGLQGWAFASHKVARLLSPWAVIAHLLVLADSGRSGRAIAAAEVAGAAVCVGAALAPPAMLRMPRAAAGTIRAPGYFLIALCASGVGGAQAVFGGRRHRGYWERTPRGRGDARQAVEARRICT